MGLHRGRRAFRNWPTLRPWPHGYVIRGRCMTVEAWEACQLLSLIAVVASGLALLTASTVGLWSQNIPVIPGSAWHAVADTIASARHWITRQLFALSPTLARALAPIPCSPVDWPLAGLGALMLFASRPLGRFLSALLPIVLRPLVVRKFRITITHTHVQIGRPLWSVQLTRDDDGPEPVRFRAVGPDEYYSRFRAAEARERRLLQPLCELPPAVVEVSHGFKRYVVLFARRADRAQAIVSRCQEAMQRTRHTFPFKAG